MEVNWFASVGLRKTYVPSIFPALPKLIVTPRIIAGSGKSILWFVFMGHVDFALLTRRSAPQLSKMPSPNATVDWPSLPISTSISETPASRSANTYYPLSLPNFLLSQILIVIYSPAFITHIRMAGDSPVKEI